MNDLGHGLYSTASVSTNTVDLRSETLVYHAEFDNTNWQGEITAYNLKTTDNDGSVRSVVWKASDMMNRGDRQIISYNPSTKQGIKLEWDQLDDNQQSRFNAGSSSDVGKARLAWAKGSNVNERRNGLLRPRETILGDIVHSNLNLRGRFTNFGYKELPGKEGTSYATFLGKKRNTKDTLFVGANDGMLHALDAKTGDELFAFMPNEVMQKIPTISSPKYGCDDSTCLPHEYLVDGKSNVTDVYFNNKWHNVLIGTLGLGGKGIYALDVSDPAQFSAQDVLWEISAKQSPNNEAAFIQHMGLSIPEPVVVKMQNGQWAAIVANGYESQYHQAVLFIIDIETGRLIKTISTWVGSTTEKNGLSSPTAVDKDGDFIADVIYAGDLQGNLWSFDVSSTNPDEWQTKFGTPVTDTIVKTKKLSVKTSRTITRCIPSPTDDCDDPIAQDARTATLSSDETSATEKRMATDKPFPLFRTCFDAACTNPRPITAKPQVGRNPAGGLMVYFGTGKYFDLGDNFDATVNGYFDTFYGLHDNDDEIASGKLVEQKILQEIKTDVDIIRESNSRFSGRMSWKKLR